VAYVEQPLRTKSVIKALNHAKWML